MSDKTIFVLFHVFIMLVIFLAVLGFGHILFLLGDELNFQTTFHKFYSYVQRAIGRTAYRIPHFNEVINMFEVIIIIVGELFVLSSLRKCLISWRSIKEN